MPRFPRRCSVAFAAAAAAGLVHPALGQEPVVDSAFRPTVERPAYAPGSGPLVLLDEAHHNVHSLQGFYAPFGRLLEADGYRVAPLRSRLDAGALEGAGVLVISNALAASTSEASDTLGSAFTDEEIEALVAWIEAGGGLLLFVDHRPFPRAAAELGRRLGLEMIDGYALDYEVWDPLVFRRGDGTLVLHPITEGRGPEERVDSVATFIGHAMRALDPAVRPLMVYGPEVESMHPEGLWEIGDDTPRVPVGGWLQAAVREIGRGRVVVFGEAGMAVAQRVGPRGEPRGMNAPVASGNAAMLLNAVRWLSGILEPDSLNTPASRRVPRP